MQLPPNVSAVSDRHGKTRYRYRRRGVKGGYLPGKAWSPEWLAKYAEYQSQEAIATQVKGKPVIARSLDHVARELRASTRWKRQKPRTQIVYGRDLDRWLDTTNNAGVRFGERQVTAVSIASLERNLATLSDKPGAADLRRKVMKRLFGYAIKMRLRTDNPALETDPIKMRGSGTHPWTEAEIEQYRARHPYGTMARLVLALALNTAARRCNVAMIERDHIKGGRIAIAHAKDNEETTVPLTDETRKAIAALPSAPIKHLVITQFGKPFTVPGLGNKMRQWCDEAGLPHCSMHGLRKAVSRRLAEGGATAMQGRSITGHKKDSTFHDYAESANRATMADEVFDKINR